MPTLALAFAYVSTEPQHSDSKQAILITPKAMPLEKTSGGPPGGPG